MNNKEALEDNLKQLIATIMICKEKKYITPCLILLYSGIDIMAFLSTPESQNKATRCDFIKWTNDYLLPGAKLNCTALDIYAARCGMVHTFTSESDLSRKKEAREIFYAWGNSDADNLQKVIDNKSIPNKIAIHIEDLFGAFITGIERFNQEIEKEPQKEKIAYNKAKKMFCNILINK